MSSTDQHEFDVGMLRALHAYAGHTLRAVYSLSAGRPALPRRLPTCADRLAAARHTALHLQHTPILYFGAGTCGLASGMDQLIPVLRDLLNAA